MWTIAPVSPRISARLPKPTAGGELAVAFRACSRRTCGSPSLLLLLSRIVRGRSPRSLPMESPLLPGAWRGPFRRRAENVQSQQSEGYWVGSRRWAGSVGPAGRGGNEEASRQAGNMEETPWRGVSSGRPTIFDDGARPGEDLWARMTRTLDAVWATPERELPGRFAVFPDIPLSPDPVTLPVRNHQCGQADSRIVLLVSPT
jgi:hypothetical protein